MGDAVGVGLNEGEPGYVGCDFYFLFRHVVFVKLCGFGNQFCKVGFFDVELEPSCFDS